MLGFLKWTVQFYVSGVSGTNCTGHVSANVPAGTALLSQRVRQVTINFDKNCSNFTLLRCVKYIK